MATNSRLPDPIRSYKEAFTKEGNRVQKLFMDLITPAIVAALGKLAEPAVKDAYEGLKGVLKRKFSAKKVIPAIEELETTPQSEGRRQVLAEELNACRAEDDSEVATAVQLLQQKLRLQDSRQNVQQTVTGSHNIFSGTGDVKVRQGES